MLHVSGKLLLKQTLLNQVFTESALGWWGSSGVQSPMDDAIPSIFFESQHSKVIKKNDLAFHDRWTNFVKLL